MEPLDEGIADTFIQWQPLSLGGILPSVSNHSPKDPQWLLTACRGSARPRHSQ